jgi:hypothetical protein
MPEAVSKYMISFAVLRTLEERTVCGDSSSCMESLIISVEYSENWLIAHAVGQKTEN